jgi:hypothetical protein
LHVIGGFTDGLKTPFVEINPQHAKDRSTLMADPALSKTEHLFKRSRPAPLLAGRACRFAAAVATAVIVTATAVPPAFAGMCDQPPFGVKRQEIYNILTSIAGPDAVHDMLHNICRAKYMQDTKMRQTLHRIGFSDELIDDNDVGYVAYKVLQALKECVDASQCR